MNLTARMIRRFAAALCAGAALCCLAPAQTATNSPAVPVHSRLPRVAPPSPPLLLPTSGKPPVQFFRELLAMTPFERIAALTNRSPEARKLIFAKIREYESFRPDQRELRLQATDLRYYLWPLMNSPSTNRAARLQHIPEPTRKLVEDRLEEWDKLPADVRTELLDNEAAIRYFAELSTSTELQKSNILAGLSPARREKLEAGVRQWQGLPEDQRQKMMARFNQFFDLTAAEKDKALSTLSEPERQQIEKTLRKFDRLSPLQRAQCIRSFEKFTRLSLDERQQFLKNAERWKLMSPNERQAWKDLVAKLPARPPIPRLPAHEATNAVVSGDR